MASERTLYIVATPIGNRDDISSRAIATLQNVDRIYAEDTRHSSMLLSHHGIKTPTSALHEHNEDALSDSITAFLLAGGSAALISDAGTPLISDPGYRLVRACQQARIRVSPIPGACAVTAALSVSGLPTDRFQFVGFPPAKSAARCRWLAPLANLSHTLVFYESPHRIVNCLVDMAKVFGDDRPMTVARELTKRFETIMQGSIGDVQKRINEDSNERRGEFVVVLGGLGLIKPDASQSTASVDLDKTIKLLLKHMSIKAVSQCAAELCEVPRKYAYKRALEIQRE